jgi:hypothetical protein
MPNQYPLNRRALFASAMGLLLPAATSAGAAFAADAAPMRCADFLDTIGVNTHVGYDNSQYRDVSGIADALKYVGVKYVRDAANKAENIDRYRALAAAGVSFCMFWGPKREMAEALGQIATLEAEHPGAVHFLEGPNEIKPNYAYAGKAGNAAGQQFMIDLRAAASADPRIRNKPLVSFTSYERVASDCDFANHHPYPKAGAQPATLLRALRERYVGPAGVMPGKPMVFTEFGYHTLVGQPSTPGAWQGVDPERQAVLLVNALFDNAAQSITRTYIYQLLDGNRDDGARPNQEKHFGLFNFDGSPKPAASAIRALFTKLADNRPRARDFAPRRVEARIAVTAPVSCLTLQDSTGRNFLALWNETPIWDKTTFAPQEVQPISVSVALAGPAPMQAFDIIRASPVKDLGRAANAVVEVGAHPIILQIG